MYGHSYNGTGYNGVWNASTFFKSYSRWDDTDKEDVTTYADEMDAHNVLNNAVTEKKEETQNDSLM